MAVVVNGSGSITGLTKNGISHIATSLDSAGVIQPNAQTVSEDVTIGSTTNAVSGGPVTIADGYTVTVNGNWSVV